jgi:peptidoglycan hydrolase CwlO-like protein
MMVALDYIINVTKYKERIVMKKMIKMGVVALGVCAMAVVTGCGESELSKDLKELDKEVDKASKELKELDKEVDKAKEAASESLNNLNNLKNY